MFTMSPSACEDGLSETGVSADFSEAMVSDLRNPSNSEALRLPLTRNSLLMFSWVVWIMPGSFFLGTSLTGDTLTRLWSLQTGKGSATRSWLTRVTRVVVHVMSKYVKV